MVRKDFANDVKVSQFPAPPSMPGKHRNTAQLNKFNDIIKLKETHLHFQNNSMAIELFKCQLLPTLPFAKH